MNILDVNSCSNSPKIRVDIQSHERLLLRLCKRGTPQEALSHINNTLSIRVDTNVIVILVDCKCRLGLINRIIPPNRYIYTRRNEFISKLTCGNVDITIPIKVANGNGGMLCVVYFQRSSSELPC